MPSKLRLSTKLLFSFIVASVFPLLVSASILGSIFLSRIDKLSGDIALQRAGTVGFLVDNRRQKLMRALDSVSKDNMVTVNTELGFSIAVSDYLSSFALSQDLSAVIVYDTDLRPFAPEIAKAGLEGLGLGEIAGDSIAMKLVEGKDGSSSLVAYKRLVSGDSRPLGYILAVLDMTKLCEELFVEMASPVVAFDSEGRILGNSGFGSKRSIALGPDWREAAETKRSVQLAIGGESYALSFSRLYGEGADTLAWIGVGYSMDSLETIQSQGFLLFAITGLLALALTLFMSFYFSRTIAKPVLALAKVSREIAGGAYGRTASIDMQDEIGELASDFNRMSLRLDKELNERDRNLKEKEILLREVHHRVKNNLQIISSLLNLKTPDEEGPITDLLRDLQGRVAAMAMVHESLYLKGNLSTIDFAEYVESLVTGITDSWSTSLSELPVKMELELDQVSIGIDQALPLGLILNELVTNAIKHAFPKNAVADPRIRVKLRRMGDNGLSLSVSDNGIGVKNDALPKKGSLGLQITEMLSLQLGARIGFTLDGGTAWTVELPASRD